MSLGVSYMGTKRHLVPDLRRIISSCRAGAFLDVFSGMCSVGRAVAPERQVWSNDLQAFAHLVAITQFCAVDDPISRFDTLGISAAYRRSKADELAGRFAGFLAEEERALELLDVNSLAMIFDRSIAMAQSLKGGSVSSKHDLFCSRYAGSYFGYQQAIDIDAIHYAISRLSVDGLVSKDQSDAMLVALCVAMSLCSNSTGHFAQALYPKAGNIKKVASKRRRSILTEWLNAVETASPSGGVIWRKGNYAFKREANSLLGALREFHTKPSVVYADPPYTKDQYSRFYHIYETAVRYDYPSCSGIGLYRPDRISSSFSLATRVEEAMSELIAGVAQIGSCLVLSYPTDGLLSNSTAVIPDMIRKHFGCDAERTILSHQHSTMGASKGASIRNVTEIIYRVII